MKNADVIYEDGCVVSTFAGTRNAGCIDSCKSISKFNCPEGIVVDEHGNLYVCDLQNRRLRKITLADGRVHTVAGASGHGCKDGPAHEAQFDYPFGAAIHNGEIIITEVCKRIRAFSPTASAVRTIVGKDAGLACPSGVAICADGCILVADRDNHRIVKIHLHGEVDIVAGARDAGYKDGDTPTARFCKPTGLAVNCHGDIYVADSGNHCIRVIDARTGAVRTLAGTGSQGWRDGIACDAEFYHPRAVAIADDGCVYISEWGNHSIRKFDPVDDRVVTLAGGGEEGFSDGEGCTATFHSPSGLAVGRDGVLYVAENGNHCIRALVYKPEVELEAVEKELQRETRQKRVLARDIERTTELTVVAKDELVKTRHAVTSETEQLMHAQSSLKEKRPTLRAVLAQRRAELQMVKHEVMTLGSAKERQVAELATVNSALSEARVALTTVVSKRTKCAQELERADALLRTRDEGDSKAVVSEKGSSSTEAKTDTEDDGPSTEGRGRTAGVESTQAEERLPQGDEAVKEQHDTQGRKNENVTDSLQRVKEQVEAHSTLVGTNRLNLLRDLDAVNAMMQEAQRVLNKVMEEKARLENAIGWEKPACVVMEESV